MAGPWEKYQAQPAASPMAGLKDQSRAPVSGAAAPGPWTKYQAPAEDRVDQGFAVAGAQPARPELQAGLEQAVSDRNRVGGAATAAGRGAAQGATLGFYDELRGLSEAGGTDPNQPASLGSVISGGMRLLFGDQSAQKAYDAGAGRSRQELDASREAHPLATLGGELGGALATFPIAGPLNLMKEAQIVNGVQKVNSGARIVNGLATGAAYGGVQGAGSANGGLGDRVVGAALGAGIGGAFGGAVPALGVAVREGNRVLGAPIRGLINPEREAARRVAAALERDGATTADASRVVSQGQAAGLPTVIADAGGDTTRALARSSANTSPEARQTLTAATNTRFESQTDRGETLIRSLVRRADATQTADDLKAAARAQNAPAFNKAYKQAPAIWTPELEQLTTAPAVQDAIREATRRGANRATADGFKPPVNPFETVNGGVQLRVNPDGSRAVPSLQFWDHVHRGLDDAYDVAIRKGANSEARDIAALNKNLLATLDNAVPDFAKARQGAASFFGAQDALEAGQKFVTAKVGNAEARKAVAKMNAAEKELFSEGFASDLIARVRETGDRRSILNSMFVNSPAARERIEIALGPQAAQKLETFLRTENAMDLLRTAIQGNSTTARQLVELGLAGGAGAAVSGGNLNDPKAWITGALLFGARRAGVRIDANVARRVGEMLASKDPQILNKGLRAISRNTQMTRAIRSVEEQFGRLAGPGGSAAQREPLHVTVTQPANWPQTGSMPAAAGEDEQKAPRQR